MFKELCNLWPEVSVLILFIFSFVIDMVPDCFLIFVHTYIHFHDLQIYQTGTEYFNNKPSKGIAYLQEQGLLADPLDPGEVINFIKENPKLDKKMLGEFITKRGNAKILEAFVK